MDSPLSFQELHRDENRHRCLDLVADLAGVTPDRLDPTQPFEALGLRVERVLRAVEEGLGVLFQDGVEASIPTVGALLQAVEVLSTERLFLWPDPGAKGDVPAWRRSVRGCLAQLDRSGRVADALGAPETTSPRVVLSHGKAETVRLDGPCTHQEGVPTVEGIALIGLPEEVVLEAGARYEVEGWLRLEPDQVPRLEVFSVARRDRAERAFGAWRLSAFASLGATDRDAHAGFEVLSATLGGHAAVSMVRSVGKRAELTQAELRGLWTRLGETEGDGSIFDVWDEVKRNVAAMDADALSELPRERTALLVELERRMTRASDPRDKGLFTGGCTLVLAEGSARGSIVGLHRVVLVHEGRAAIVGWEHSARREAARTHGEEMAQGVPGNISCSSFEQGYEEKPPPFEVAIPEGARLLLVSGGCLEAELGAFEAAVVLGEPQRIAEALASLSAPVGRPSGLVCIEAAAVPRPLVAVARGARAYGAGCAGGLRDRYVREGLLPRWAKPTPSHVARRLPLPGWVTVDARHAEGAHFEDPRFDGMFLRGPGSAACEEGELYRVEGWIEASFPSRRVNELHPVAVEARRAGPVRVTPHVSVRAHRGRMRRRTHLDETLVAPPIARFDALLVGDARSTTLLGVATDEEDTPVLERLRDAFRSRGRGARPPSLFTVLDDADAPCAGGPMDLGSPGAPRRRALAAMALQEAAALAVVRFQGGGVRASCGPDMRLGRVGGSEITWLDADPERAPETPLDPGAVLVLAWGGVLALPSSVLAESAARGESALAHVCETWPALDTGDWGFVWIVVGGSG
ncbi:acyl carrier protein [Chondromyces crocatus]|uniref:Uncharacterized protein n=1 Tax=Chondromyces crocatus TaxID=52 RepID=A0A0K1ELW6_CHOCO|nr:acyl carrier protein [Chondromyces crocatus]AKT41821.1 uncharacterized protein CMC5_060320 [Chondromyces crocatus]